MSELREPAVIGLVVMLFVGVVLMIPRDPAPEVAVAPPAACVRFTEASDDLLRLTVRLAGISRAGASAAAAGNEERLSRAVVRLGVLQSDLAELSPRYTQTKEGCLT